MIYAKKEIQKQEIEKQKEKKNEIILIVCEGEKTEKNYLNQLKDFFRLSNVSINIISSKKPNPSQIVEFTKEKNKDYSYNKVYCVFDKDTHSDFDKAKQECEKYKFEAITSNPCFEFWILLHFTYTTKSFSTNSPCNELIESDLKKHIKDYKKDYNFTSIIKQNLSTALLQMLKKRIKKQKKITIQAHILLWINLHLNFKN